VRLPALHTVQPEATDLAAKLEEGHILFFPRTPLALPPEADLDFLRTALASRMRLKNISYHPPEDMLSGIGGDREGQARTQRILREHNQRVQTLLAELLPKYAAAWRVGKVNFRPVEEHGRQLSRHASNEFIHVDAFPSGATHGARVLRFFTNVNPSETRVWRSSGVFAELYRDFASEAGIARKDLREKWPDKMWSATLRGVGKIYAGAELADSSPYDRAMRALHNYLKDSDTFQSDASRYIDVEFPPFSSWAVLTDGVSHACLRGQHALVNTFYIPVAACARPELAPLSIMEAQSLSQTAS
jgi:hypothetical protein